MYGQTDIRRSPSARLPSPSGRPVLPPGGNAFKISASSAISRVSLLNAEGSFAPVRKAVTESLAASRRKQASPSHP